MPDPDLPQLGERMGEINNAGCVRLSAIDKRSYQRTDAGRNHRADGILIRILIVKKNVKGSRVRIYNGTRGLAILIIHTTMFARSESENYPSSYHEERERER